MFPPPKSCALASPQYSLPHLLTQLPQLDHSRRVGFHDNEMKSQAWQDIAHGNVKAVLDSIAADACYAKMRAGDGRGPLFWAHEFYSEKIIKALVASGRTGATGAAVPVPVPVPARALLHAFVSITVLTLYEQYCTIASRCWRAGSRATVLHDFRFHHGDGISRRFMSTGTLLTYGWSYELVTNTAQVELKSGRVLCPRSATP
jgi:hypothetical protein